MPIAHCIVSPECLERADRAQDPVALWSAESQQSADYMALTFVASALQFGDTYPVMANLALPSIWPEHERRQLQMGLARALARYFGESLDAVHVVTRIVDSGMVVEHGEILEW